MRTGKDLIPAPAEGCPVNPDPVAYNGPVILCVAGPGVVADCPHRDRHQRR